MLPLEGYCVIDCSQVFAGPATAMYLADLGADVIKVERPGGEDCRNLDTSAFLGRDSRPFMALNRNKRGIVVDITRPQGVDVIRRMAAQADVFIENFTLGTADRLGIGCDDLWAVNPRLIYASVTGFGLKGPYAPRAAYDLIVQGLSGIAEVRRDPSGRPMPAPLWVSDCSAPMLMAYGITAALLQREKTGVGQRVETSLFAAAIAMQSTFLVRVPDDPAEGARAASQATYQPYRCSDGTYINVVILNERQWRNLCRILEIEHLADDPDFNTVQKRSERTAELFPLLEGLFESRPAAEWVDLLSAAQIPCGPIISRARVYDEPQVLDNDLLVDVQHPTAGPTRILGFPLKLSDATLSVRRPAPTIGQHTDEVLGEFGFGPQQIAKLRADGVLGGS